MLDLSASQVVYASLDLANSYSSQLFSFQCKEKLSLGLGKLSSLKSDLVDLITTLALSIINGLNHVVEPMKKIAIFNHMAQIVYVPLVAMTLVKNCIHLPTQEREKKIDTGLNICSNLREISESIATFLVALERIELMPASILSWGVPFTAVMSVLSLASIASKFRTCLKVRRFMQSFKQAEELGKVEGKLSYLSYTAILNLIESEQMKDNNFISEMFNTSEDNLADLLINTQLKAEDKLASTDPKDLKEAQEIVERVVKGLKNRVKQNIVSSVLAITSSVVNIIGTVLLLSLPILPVGWAVFAVGTMIDGGRFICHKVGEYRFAKAIELKRTKWEWITC